jgi:hypothetical protein
MTLIEDTDAILPASLLLKNDYDVDGTSFKIVGIQSASGGTATLLADGNLHFSPAANLAGAGAAQVVYIIEDPSGLQASATVVLDITPVNDAPVVTGEILSTVYHGTGALILPFNSLPANDSDIEQETLDISAVGNAVGGTVQILAGQVVSRQIRLSPELPALPIQSVTPAAARHRPRSSSR